MGMSVLSVTCISFSLVLYLCLKHLIDQPVLHGFSSQRMNEAMNVRTIELIKGSSDKQTYVKKTNKKSKHTNKKNQNEHSRKRLVSTKHLRFHDLTVGPVPDRFHAISRGSGSDCYAQLIYYFSY